MPKPWKAVRDPDRGAHRTSPCAADTLPDRFWAKVRKDAMGAGCWDWTGGKNHAGYGMIWTAGRPYQRPAHRISLELAGIVIPDGMFIDHLCHNRGCVNPLHLRIVTPRQNSTENNDSPLARNARKTHCSRGHEYSQENTAIVLSPMGRRKLMKPARVCLTCFPSRWRYAIVPRDPPTPEAARRAARKGGGWIGPMAKPSMNQST